MKKIVKALLILLGLALVALGVGAVLLWGPIRDVCKTDLEKRLTRAMGSQITVDGISIVPWRREIVLLGLAVANPEGFKEGTAMRFDRIVVKPDIGTLLSQTPVIESAVLEGGHIQLRYEVAKGTNLQRLAEHAAESSEQSSGNEGSGRFFEVPNEFIVKELSVEQAEVELSTNVIPLSSVQLDLVSFTLHDVSKDEPVGAADLTVVFLRSLLKEVVTLKGILAPVAEALGKEIGGWFGEDETTSAPGSGNALPTT